MLVLFESPAGYAIFKVLDEGKLADVDNIHKEFASKDKAAAVVKLKAFHKFEDTTAAVAAATALVDGKLDKQLKKFLKKNAKGEDLAVVDNKFGGMLKDKMSLSVVWDNKVCRTFLFSFFSPFSFLFLYHILCASVCV